MGGRGSTYVKAAPATALAPGSAPTPSGYTLSDLQNMGDRQLHDLLIDVDSIDMPDFLNTRSHLQRMLYALGANDKPEIVSQAAFNAEVASGGTEIWRTVPDTDLQGYTAISAGRIQQMLLYGDLTYVGRGIHGDGLYFSDSESGSKLYGSSYQGKSATIDCVLNSKARVISENQLKTEYDRWVQTHPQSRRALGFAKQSHNSHDSYAQFALIRGYNVITSYQGGGEYYYTILDRGVLSTTGAIEKF